MPGELVVNQSPAINLVFSAWLLLFPMTCFLQTSPPKETRQNTTTWLSLNTQWFFNQRWSLFSDASYRRSDFISNPQLILLRTYPVYRISPSFSAAAGYAHLWSAPDENKLDFMLDEDRLFEQLVASSRLKKTNLIQRLRIEQRWQEFVVNSRPSDLTRFTLRYRYLVSFRIPVTNRKYFPSLVLAEELMLHSGKVVEHGNFEQNRIYAGLFQRFSRMFSMDLGYMYVYQKRINGYQYNSNHVIRLYVNFERQSRHLYKESREITE
jgi:hypothetical protein